MYKIILGEKKMESEMGKKIKVKLVKAHHWNLIFLVPTREGVKKLKIRWANQIIYLQRIAQFVEDYGTEYTKRIHSIYNGLTYLNTVHEAELSKEQLLSLLDVPRRKSMKYEALMKLLKEA